VLAVRTFFRAATINTACAAWLPAFDFVFVPPTSLFCVVMKPGGLVPASFVALSQRPARGATTCFGHVGFRLGCETGAVLASRAPSSLVSGSGAHHQHYQSVAHIIRALL